MDFLSVNEKMDCLDAFLMVAWCQFWIFICTTALDGFHDVETRIVADFAHGPYGSSRLVEKDVERPWGGTCADENALFSFH